MIDRLIRIIVRITDTEWSVLPDPRAGGWLSETCALGGGRNYDWISIRFWFDGRSTGVRLLVKGHWRPSLCLDLDVLCFYTKQVYRPSDCEISTNLDKILHTHIVVRNTLVGQLWPRSARGRLQDKPKRLLFVILVTHPKYRDDGSPRFRRQTVNSGGDDGCYREKFRNFVAWAEPDPKKQHFPLFMVPYDYPAHSLQKTVLPQTNGTDGKPRLQRCTFASLASLVSCYQAFGRYSPLKGAEKWSCDQHENWKFAFRHTQKNSRFQKCYTFRPTTKNNEIIAENTFKNKSVNRLLWTLGRLELTLVVDTSFLLRL